jgi:hypothetical protein
VIAHFLHTDIATIGEMTLPELERWHDVAVKLSQKLYGKK